MTLCRCAAPMLAAISLLLAPTAGRGQPARKGPVADPLARVRVGEWVQLEGVLQANLTIMCTEVKLLTGDFLDDDWSVQGTVRAIDAGRREFSIADLRIQVTANTAFGHPTGTFRGFSDLRPGIPVDVEGTYVRNGRFLAAEVDDETDEMARRPGLRHRIIVVGRVERVDHRARAIAAVGLLFRVTDRTKLRSVIE